MLQSKVISQQISVISDGGWVNAFAGHLEGEGASERTIGAYCQDVRSFAAWFVRTNGQELEPELITGVDLRAYRRWCLDEERVAASTWNRRRASLGVLCLWAYQSGMVSYNPFQGVEAVAVEELAPRSLEGAEFQRLMRAVEQAVNGAKTEAWKRQAIRDRALITIMAYAGLREGEVVALDVADVALSERKGRLVIRLGKGDKRREVPLNSEARMALRMWMDVALPREAVFTGKGGGRLSTRQVQRVVAEVGRKAGLVVTPHDLRHTCAKRLLDGGAPLTVVQKVLGHARLETTARYVKPGWGDLEKAVERI